MIYDKYFLFPLVTGKRTGTFVSQAESWLNCSPLFAGLFSFGSGLSRLCLGPGSHPVCSEKTEGEKPE